MKPLSALLVLVMLVLSACTTVQADELKPANNEPEDAVYDWMREQPSPVANTTAIRQVRQLDNTRAPVLISFAPEGWKGEPHALALFEVGRQGNKWISHGYHHAPESKQAITLHNHQPASDITWAAAYGWVSTEHATQVRLHWSDGLEETLSVKNSTYLSIRTLAEGSRAEAIEVTALDAKGNALTK